MPLEEYHRKRHFDRTAEPPGKSQARKRRSTWRFVIQKHDATRLHYDFRLELDGVLKSWAVPLGPCLDPSQKRLAVRVEDHPLEYGDFEGIIPPGEYGGGTVLLWDHGTWSPLGNAEEDYARGKLKFVLNGEKLRGAWMLVRMKKREGEKGDNWLLFKERDAEARLLHEYNVLDEQPASVSSGRTLGEIAANPDRTWHSEKPARNARPAAKPARPRRKKRVAPVSAPVSPAEIAGAKKAAFLKEVEPQLARLALRPPEGREWIHEIKFDGYRLFCHVQNGKAVLKTRNHIDWTKRFPEIAAALGQLPVKDAVLDGEVVSLLPSGASSFPGLQEALSSRKTGKLVYYAFDLLYLDGYDLRGVRLEERKRALAAILPKEGRGRLQVSDHLEGSGAQFFEQCPQLGLEGIVSKRRDRPWQAGRGEDWLKSKCVQREEFVIGGYTDSAASRHDLGALLVGYYVTGKGLAYAGKVGTGFTAKTHRDLRERLKAREQDASPFAGPTEPGETVHWVRPELVAEVEYRNWTRDGLLWHPSFLGLREDRVASSVVRDDAPLPAQSANQKEPREPARKPAAKQPPKPRRPRSLTKTEVKALQKVELTHPGRILYPAEGITKRDLVGYYAAVAEWMLPHVINRPVSFVRCPRGQGGPQFFQKHLAAGTPETLRRVVIREKDKDETYLVIDDLPGLVSVVQMSVLEIHPWGATSDDVEHPDRMIFDLDPDPAVGWPTVIEAAREIHDLLDDIGLESFVKTSGGKGLHVVVPLQRRHGWDELKRFARAFCHQLANKSPQRYTANMSKSARPGKIYLDYVRNSRGATAVAPYSTRATERATVSMPIAWDELSPDIGPAYFHVGNVPDRLASMKRDPWQKFFSVRQSLTAAILRRFGV
jgi:bifunctional non-homologous end joining protein LigD